MAKQIKKQLDEEAAIDFLEWLKGELQKIAPGRCPPGRARDLLTEIKNRLPEIYRLVGADEQPLRLPPARLPQLQKGQFKKRQYPKIKISHKGV